MTSIKNTAPQAFNLLGYEIGFTKLRVVHASPVDLDINKRTAWYTLASTPPNTGDTRVDVVYNGDDYFTISSLAPATAYDFTLTLVDDFIASDNTLLNAQNVNPTLLTPYVLANTSTKTQTLITNVVNNIGTGEIGAPPSTVQITMSGSAGTLIELQVSTDGTNWSNVYSGNYTSEVNITLAAGTYYFRVNSTFLFSDGTVDIGGVHQYATTVDVGNDISNPSPISGLVVTGFKDSNVAASYIAKLDWTHTNNGGANRHYSIQFQEYDGVTPESSLTWTGTSQVAATETTYTFTNFPLRKQYAFRVGYRDNLYIH
jgi:hypothetical protein